MAPPSEFPFSKEQKESAVGVKELSFEEALQALEQIVTQLERGDVPLAQSIEIYERGEALRKHCMTLLKAAEARIEKIQCDKETALPTGIEPLDNTDEEMV